MSERLREVAAQTVAIVEAGGYRSRAGEQVDISAQVRAAVTGTRHYLPDHVLDAGGAAGKGVVEVTDESTLSAAGRLGPEAACLVFGSATNPGGGFRNGARAQEESVARASTLFACLQAAPEFYTFHREQRDLRYSDRVIYSPQVPVFRDDHDGLLDQPYLTSMITAAAPNYAAISRNQPEHLTSVPEVLRLRARRILEVAAAHRHRIIVLGGWGCGVFGNKPAMVADAFAQGLRRVARFDRIVFAIHDRLPGTPVHAAFTRRLT